MYKMLKIIMKIILLITSLLVFLPKNVAYVKKLKKYATNNARCRSDNSKILPLQPSQKLLCITENYT